MNTNIHIHHYPDLSVFKKISLDTPIQISDKNYFCKISDYTWNNKIPNILFVQTPECFVNTIIDASIIKKNIHLVFSTKDNSVFIDWIKQLHIHVKNELFNNRKKWFKTELEYKDFDTMLPPFLTSIEDGDGDAKYTLNTSAHVFNKTNVLKIYDTNENEITLTDITPQKSKVITVLEFRGIKCLQQQFFLPEIFIRQILVVSNTNKGVDVDVGIKDGVNVDVENKCCIISPPLTSMVAKDNNNLEVLKTISEQFLELDFSYNVFKSFLSVSDIENNDDNDDNDPKEVEINLDTADKVILKPPQEIYYKMYQDAKERAKIARAEAVTAFLEAKHIKNLYDLDCISSDDEEEEYDDGDFI